jgi:ATP-dependent protease ClpP protease subunit
MRPCFKFLASAAGQPAVLDIFDEIGGWWGVSANDFIAGVDAVQGNQINVRINSPGGDVFAALAMYNILRASGKEITTEVVGVAASCASLIFMAGDKRVMPKNTMLMIHNPWTFTGGNADELREMADTLDKVGNSVAGSYQARTGMKEADLAAMLAKDTWLNADEALANGFATEITPDVQVSASFDMDRADLPANVRAIYQQAQPKTPEQLQAQAAADAATQAQALKDAQNPVATAVHDLAIKAGLKDYANFLAVSCASLEVAQARIKTAGEIVALCTFAEKPEAAAPAIRANQSVAEVRAEIIKQMAEADVHTNNVKPLNAKTNPPAAPAAVSPSEIWAAYRAQDQKK